MEARKAMILSSSAVIILVILIVVLQVSLGNTRTFIGLAAACLIAIIGIFVWLLRQYTALDYRRRVSLVRRAEENRVGEQIQYEYSFLRRVAGLPAKFKYETLFAATDGFNTQIGRGSSAMVYKGILDDGTAVAVKKIEAASEHGDRAFRSEVSAIASVQHLNLVRLLGYCVLPNHPRFLVYEFVPNGSLDKWIFPPSKKGTRRRRGRPLNPNANHDDDPDDQRGGWEPDAELQQQQRCLPWALRYRIAADVARALAYLHNDCRSKILHMDVKPENILLDEGFHALVADFGLSKLMGRDQSRIITTVRGTRGYLAPEWLLGRGVTEKSDVYSYGLVLLELVGGRRNVRAEEEEPNGQRHENGTRPASKPRWSYFPKIAMDKVKEGTVMEIVDQRLLQADAGNGDVDEKEVTTLVYVALWCIQEDAKLRPSMARVVDMLEGRLPAEMPPETDMVIIDLLDIDGSNSSAAAVAEIQAGPAAQSRLSVCCSGFSTLSPR